MHFDSKRESLQNIISRLDLKNDYTNLLRFDLGEVTFTDDTKVEKKKKNHEKRNENEVRVKLRRL